MEHQTLEQALRSGALNGRLAAVYGAEGAEKAKERCAAAAALFSFLGRVGASVSVFQAPHAGHCPDHLAVSFPHSVQ